MFKQDDGNWKCWCGTVMNRSGSGPGEYMECPRCDGERRRFEARQQKLQQTCDNIQEIAAARNAEKKG